MQVYTKLCIQIWQYKNIQARRKQGIKFRVKRIEQQLTSWLFRTDVDYLFIFPNSVQERRSLMMFVQFN